MKTDTVFEALKEWVQAANPGFVTKEDLARVERRLDDLGGLVDALEERLAAMPNVGSASQPSHGPEGHGEGEAEGEGNTHAKPPKSGGRAPRQRR